MKRLADSKACLKSVRGSVWGSPCFVTPQNVGNASSCEWNDFPSKSVCSQNGSTDKIVCVNKKSYSSLCHLVASYSYSSQSAEQLKYSYIPAGRVCDIPEGTYFCRLSAIINGSLDSQVVIYQQECPSDCGSKNQLLTENAVLPGFTVVADQSARFCVVFKGARYFRKWLSINVDPLLNLVVALTSKSSNTETMSTSKQ